MARIVRLEIPIDVLRDVRQAAKTALAKHIRKSYAERNVDRRADHQRHAERMRAFLSAIEAQVGDIRGRREP